jgi:hypothetical protein
MMPVRRFSGRRFGLRLLSLLANWSDLVRQLLPLRRELQPRRFDAVVPRPLGLGSAFLSFFSVLVSAVLVHSFTSVGLGSPAGPEHRSVPEPNKRQARGWLMARSGFASRVCVGEKGRQWLNHR